MKFAILFLYALLGVAQPRALEESIDALATPATNVGHVQQLVTSHEASNIIPAILERLSSDPSFARGSAASNWAIRALASTRVEDGRIRISDRRQVEVLAEALSWSDIQSQFAILQVVRQIDSELRPLVASPIARLIMDGRPSLICEALKASVEGELTLPQATKERIRELAIAADSQANVWTAANKVDSYMMGGPEMVSRLRTLAVASYLTGSDDLATAWREIAATRGASGNDVLKGAVLASVELAKRGAISKAGIENDVFDAMVTLCNDPSARQTTECCVIMLLIDRFSKPGDDQVVMARGAARLIIECDAIPQVSKEYTVNALKLKGFCELADEIAALSAAKPVGTSE